MPLGIQEGLGGWSPFPTNKKWRTWKGFMYIGDSCLVSERSRTKASGMGRASQLQPCHLALQRLYSLPCWACFWESHAWGLLKASFTATGNILSSVTEVVQGDHRIQAHLLLPEWVYWRLLLKPSSHVSPVKWVWSRWLLYLSMPRVLCFPHSDFIPWLQVFYVVWLLNFILLGAQCFPDSR